MRHVQCWMLQIRFCWSNSVNLFLLTEYSAQVTWPPHLFSLCSFFSAPCHLWCTLTLPLQNHLIKISLKNLNWLHCAYGQYSDSVANPTPIQQGPWFNLGLFCFEFACFFLAVVGFPQMAQLPFHQKHDNIQKMFLSLTWQQHRTARAGPRCCTVAAHCSFF